MAALDGILVVVNFVTLFVQKRGRICRTRVPHSHLPPTRFASLILCSVLCLALSYRHGKFKRKFERLADVPGMVMLCVEMHRRYPAFAESLIPMLLHTVNNAGGGGGSGGGGSAADGEGGLPRRVCFRLLTEFVLHGIMSDVRPVFKIVEGACGAPSEEGREYAVTDAGLIVTFARAGGHEILGGVGRTLRWESERLRAEIEGRGEASLVLVSEEDAGEGAAAAPAAEQGAVAAAAASETKQGSDSSKQEDKGKAAADEKATPKTESVDLDAPFNVILSPKLRQRCLSILDAFDSAVPSSRAVPPAATASLHGHAMGAYRTLSRSYTSTHRRLLKLEKRCEQDRLLQGSLSESREKGLTDARSLMDSLRKSVETLSEALDVDAPVLEEEEANEGEGEMDGKGIELWTKNGDDGEGEDLGPFDDEETRSFYCDVPDLLSIKPPALLGINAVDLEKQKERNARQYGDGGGEDGEEAEMGDLAVVDEANEGDDLPKEDATLEEAGGDGDDKDGEIEEGEDGEKGEYCASERHFYRSGVKPSFKKHFMSLKHIGHCPDSSLGPCPCIWLIYGSPVCAKYHSDLV